MNIEILDLFLDAGYTITIYSNALGTITAKASKVDETIIDIEDDVSEYHQPTPYDATSQSGIITEEIITDGPTVTMALQRLYQKTELKKRA